MAFSLGNFSIDEILYGVAENFDGDLLYTMDQLSSASIEISSDSTDITDKNGNVVRTIYKSKTGTFSATNAFLHPQIMNAASGSDIKKASAEAAINMPRIDVIAAGGSLILDEGVDADSIAVIGLYGSGANSEQLTKATGSTPAKGQYAYDTATRTIKVPAQATGEPVKYLVKYERSAKDGWMLTNAANNFPATVKLTLFCSYVDPCDDDLRPAYVVLPSFQASPETTISLSADEQEMDFSGSMQIDFCAAEQALYYIYLPTENVVVSGNVA